MHFLPPLDAPSAKGNFSRTRISRLIRIDRRSSRVFSFSLSRLLRGSVWGEGVAPGFWGRKRVVGAGV